MHLFDTLNVTPLLCETNWVSCIPEIFFFFFFFALHFLYTLQMALITLMQLYYAMNLYITYYKTHFTSVGMVARALLSRSGCVSFKVTSGTFLSILGISKNCDTRMQIVYFVLVTFHPLI